MHVFLSYERDDRPAAERVARSLEAEGWRVWWDPKIKPHQRYTDVIDAAIESASAVLVLWSARARESAWVRSEASEGLAARKLVQARIDQSKPPRPFDQFQIADLSDWRGDPRHEARASLTASLRDLVGQSAVSSTARPPRRSGGASILAGLAAAAMGAGAAGWLLSPDLRDLVRYGGAVQVNVSVEINRANVAKVEGDVAAMVEDNPEIF